MVTTYIWDLETYNRGSEESFGALEDGKESRESYCLGWRKKQKKLQQPSLGFKDRLGCVSAKLRGQERTKA